MGLSKSSDGDTLVIGDLGSDIGNESRIADSSFSVEYPLVGCRFPLLHFTYDLVQLCFFQGLVPVDLFRCFFNFFEQFPSDSKSRISGMAYSGGGEEKRVTGRPAIANQLIVGRGG
jgi:hypothetical protein